VSAVDARGETIFVADAHRDEGKRFVVRADQILTAFLEFEAGTRDPAEIARALLNPGAAALEFVRCYDASAKPSASTPSSKSFTTRGSLWCEPLFGL